MSRSLQWYGRRLSKMSPAEVAWRAHDAAWQRAWARRQVRPGGQLGDDTSPALVPGAPARFTAVLPAGGRDSLGAALPAEVRVALGQAAEEILAGRFEVLGIERTDLRSPDWFRDPLTGRRAPADQLAFRIDHRSEEVTGNVKQVWELSRLHHLTLLAAAWYAGVAGEECVKTIDDQLRSWWSENPFLSGVNWTSGIEIGIRLISFVWIRRLLDDWPGVASLFEENADALHQIAWHQEYLDRFVSRGSSANNHVIAEAAGQLVASCAFPWFEASERWRRRSTALLEEQLRRNTFPSGVNREQASSYHWLVAELALLAGAEADVAGRPLSEATWELIARMLDAGAATLDETGRPPRQGDGDDGRGLVVDPPGTQEAMVILGAGAATVGSLEWWPAVRPSVGAALVGSLASGRRVAQRRLRERPSHFEDAGLTILRTAAGRDPELWCRCDGGPHGFLSIAAHAHADALAVEVRCGGVDILADPGTYCYHGEPQWRAYFRSTIGHNTVEIGAEDQSVSGGPFLWLRAAKTSLPVVRIDAGSGRQSWSASHDGYERIRPPARHVRTVVLDERDRALEIVDEIQSSGSQPVRVAFHLGPLVEADLDAESAVVRLAWPGGGTGELQLPSALSWSSHRGEADPVLGWYSAGFGSKEPATTLIGSGTSEVGSTRLTSRLTFVSSR